MDVEGRETGMTYLIESLKTAQPATRLTLQVQSLIWQGYGRLVAFLGYLGLAAALVLLVCRRAVRWHENVYSVLVLFGFAVFSRVALFAILDASSWPGDQPRYLLPVMPVYSCFLVLLINQALLVMRAWRRQKSGDQPR
jgi:hypothetical protein